jgi:hypothetical protein
VYAPCSVNLLLREGSLLSFHIPKDSCFVALLGFHFLAALLSFWLPSGLPGFLLLAFLLLTY